MRGGTRRVRRWVLLMWTVLLPAPAAAQDGASRALAASLVRCREASSVACIQLEGALPAAPNVAEGAERAAGDRREAMALGLGGLAWVGPLASAEAPLESPLLLLVLLDVSGSMTGDGIAYARAAVRRFLQELPDQQVRVAVVPFGSRGVEASVGRARFVAPSASLRQVDAIPTPDPRANTALYSSLRAGASTLGRLRLGDARARRAILLVTDGRNEVGGPLDDAGLLPGDSLEVAVQALSTNRVQLLAVGVGRGVGVAQLDSLARIGGRLYISALDPLAMGRSLAQVRRDLSGARRMLFATGSDLASLGRVARDSWLVYEGRGGGNDSVRIRWLPPLVALPVFSGTSALGSAGTEAVGDAISAFEGPPVERYLFLLLVVVLQALLWTAVPRWIWPDTLVQLPVVRERGDGEGAGARPEDPREAPPRGATATTGEFPIAT